jgi:GTP-sensing pleiotropic transcriptional regulator CodY
LDIKEEKEKEKEKEKRNRVSTGFTILHPFSISIQRLGTFFLYCIFIE